MSAFAYRVNEENSDYVQATIVPANRSDEPRFCLMDVAVVGCFLLCVGGLAYLVLLS